MTAKYVFSSKRQRLFTETKKVTTEIFMTTNIHCLVEHFHFSMNRPDLLAVLVCLFGFIIFNINYILLETIGVPLCQQQLGSNNVDTRFTSFQKGSLPRLILQFKTKFKASQFKVPLNNVEKNCNIFRGGLP